MKQGSLCRPNTICRSAVIVAMVLSSSRISAAPCKQQICHHNNGQEEWNTLDVACPAVSSHLAHGDLFGPCDEQPCTNLCFHETCQNDYRVLDDGRCDCDINPVLPVVCGDGAVCDMLLDECVCTDENQIFDVDGKCVYLCQPEGVSITLDLTFRVDGFPRIKTVAEANRADVLSRLAQDFPGLFALAGTSCNITVTDLDLIDLPASTETQSSINHAFDGPLCVTTYTNYQTHYGPDRQEGNRTPYMIEAICDSDNELIQEYFQSFVKEKEISYFDEVERQWKYAGSDLNFFRIMTQRKIASPKDEYGSCTELTPFYDLLVLDFSVSLSAQWGGGPYPTSGPEWLPGSVYLTCNLVPSGSLESEYPYSLWNNLDKKSIYDLNKTGVSIFAMVWQAKLYNSAYLSDLDNGLYDDFQILADVDAIHVDPGNSCGF